MQLFKMTSTSAIELFEKNDFKVIKTWLTDNSRPERDDRGVNIIVKKS